LLSFDFQLVALLGNDRLIGPQVILQFRRLLPEGRLFVDHAGELLVLFSQPIVGFASHLDDALVAAASEKKDQPANQRGLGWRVAGCNRQRRKSITKERSREIILNLTMWVVRYG